MKGTIEHWHACSLNFYDSDVCLRSGLINLIKSYYLMKRNQSYIDTSISAFYFAVYPLTLTIDRGCNSKIVIYFEKSNTWSR